MEKEFLLGFSETNIMGYSRDTSHILWKASEEQTALHKKAKAPSYQLCIDGWWAAKPCGGALALFQSYLNTCLFSMHVPDA